jgi:hypothetical protein
MHKIYNDILEASVIISIEVTGTGSQRKELIVWSLEGSIDTCKWANIFMALSDCLLNQ